MTEMITWKGDAAKVTVAKDFDYMVFLDSLHDIIGYQLPKGVLEEYHIKHEFPPPPEGTKQTILVNGVSGRLIYLKRYQKDEVPGLGSAASAGGMEKLWMTSYVGELIEYSANSLMKLRDATMQRMKEMQYCPMYNPINPYLKAKKLECEYCTHRPNCFDPRNSGINRPKDGREAELESEGYCA